MTKTVDAIVIGTGPGGEAIAGRLAEAGLDVVAVESHLVGGECPYYGCIPSKMIIRAADALAEGRRIGDLAGTAEVHADWTPVHARIGVEATVLELGPHILGPVEPEAAAVVADVFGREGIQVLTGITISRVSYDEGRFTISVGDQDVTAEKLLVAAGRIPNLDDLG